MQGHLVQVQLGLLPPQVWVAQVLLLLLLLLVLVLLVVLSQQCL